MPDLSPTFSLGFPLAKSLVFPEWYYRGAVAGTNPSLWFDYYNNRYAINQNPLSFANSQTFSRASTATYVDADGNIQTASIDEPRFDYSTGSKGLLIEESRTNFVTKSDASNLNSLGAVVTPLTLNALSMFNGATVASTGVYWHSGQTNSLTWNAGDTYTVSVWYMAGTSEQVFVCTYVDSLNTFTVSGTIGGTLTGAGSGITVSNVKEKIVGTYQDANVYKLTFNVVWNVSQTTPLSIGPNSAISGKDIIVLGSQVEKGSFPTSYIPTNGSAVTRAADIDYLTASDVGLNFSTFGDGATIYVDYELLGDIDNNYIFEISSGGSSDRVYVKSGGGTFRIVNTGVTTSISTTANIERHRIAARLKDGDIAFYMDGSLIGTATVSIPTNLIKLFIGTYYATGGQNSKGIYDLRLYEAALTDDQLEDLTEFKPYEVETLSLDYYNDQYRVNQSRQPFEEVQTFSRASTATYVDADGNIQTASIDEPRFDYSMGSKGLLIEKSRANLITYSDASKFGKIGSSAVLTPLTLNALNIFDGCSFASGGVDWHRTNASPISWTSEITYTVSIWYMKGSSDKIRIEGYLNSSVNLAIKSYIGSNSFEISVHNSTVTNVEEKVVGTYQDSNVYKLTFNVVWATDVTIPLGVGPSSSVVGEDIIVLGMQIERGSFPTSYIPTNGSAVTRGNETLRIGTEVFSDFYNQPEGTFVVDFIKPYENPLVHDRVFSCSDGTSQNRIIFLFNRSNGKLLYESIISGSIEVILSDDTKGIGRRLKVAGTYKCDDYKMSVEGREVLYNSSCSVPNITKMNIGSDYLSSASNQLNGVIYSVKYYKKSLTAEQLTKLTA